MILEIDKPMRVYHSDGSAPEAVRFGFAFTHPQLQIEGNPCALVVVEDLARNLDPPQSHVTYCLTSPAVPNKKTMPDYVVQCFTPEQQSIECCGHGLLLAAWHWLVESKQSELRLVMNDSSVRAFLEGSNDELAVEGPRVCLQFSDIVMTPVTVPLKLIDEIGLSKNSLPISAAHVGDEQGYLVLQFADNTELKKLPKPKQSISKFTQRAIIYTAAQPEHGAEAISLRYFAPQYGVDEDGATGSAMRVLARFWSARFDKLHAIQASEAGGQLFSELVGDDIIVKGYCHWFEQGDWIDQSDWGD